MEENSSLIETLYHRTEEYTKTSIELLKLTTIDKVTAIVSSVVTRLIVIGVIFLFLLILSVGVSLWLGQMFENKYTGFFIISAFYAITGIVLYFLFFKQIKKRISDAIIKENF
jgi:hypothetical protein